MDFNKENSPFEQGIFLFGKGLLCFLLLKSMQSQFKTIQSQLKNTKEEGKNTAEL